jgi:hypothetical protein
VTCVADKVKPDFDSITDRSLLPEIMSGVLAFDAPEVDQLDHDGVARQLSSHKMLSQMHQFTFCAQRPKAQRISTLYCFPVC